MTGARVYAAISGVTTELARVGIAKGHVNSTEGYSYRSIDDVMGKLAPILAKHRLCILPRVLERVSFDRQGLGDTLLVCVSLRAAFDLVSARDGSMHTIEAYGEALDGGDKATAKAMTAAFKQAVLQAFCIPAAPAADADASTPRLRASQEQADPDQGWDQWSLDLQDMIRICQSGEALDRVQQTYGVLLRTASKRRRDVYEAIGAAMRLRREAVDTSGRAAPAAQPAEPARQESTIRQERAPADG